jgi:ribulose bisphosphate carboxylase small subunit
MLDNGEEDCKLLLSNEIYELDYAIRNIEEFLHEYSKDDIRIFDFVPARSIHDLSRIIKEFQNEIVHVPLGKNR